MALILLSDPIMNVLIEFRPRCFDSSTPLPLSFAVILYNWHSSEGMIRLYLLRSVRWIIRILGDKDMKSSMTAWRSGIVIVRKATTRIIAESHYDICVIMSLIYYRLLPVHLGDTNWMSPGKDHRIICERIPHSHSILNFRMIDDHSFWKTSDNILFKLTKKGKLVTRCALQLRIGVGPR